MVPSRALKKWRAGDIVITAGVNRVAEPWLVETIGRIGFDLIWFDMEHRAFGYDRIEPLALACRATGIDLMVRILKTGYTSPMRALEFGANGILVPHCMSVEEARQWVDWVRFPPLGKRGFDGAGADAEYALADEHQYLSRANDGVFLALQVEDRECVESVEEIAAVPGVDLLFVGPADLSLSYGVPLQFDHPLVQSAIDRVAGAARRANKWWGIPTGSAEEAQSYIDRGASLVTGGNDHAFLVNGFRRGFENYRNLRRRS
jgi:4-hydroxy-2-oxoheptanedioate aldolase